MKKLNILKRKLYLFILENFFLVHVVLKDCFDVDVKNLLIKCLLDEKNYFALKSNLKLKKNEKI
jgi:hypothetical protein